MPGKRHSTDQIISKLREADEMRARGASIGEICETLNIAANTYTRWRYRYGGLDGRQKRRLAELEDENQRLKRLVAELSLDIQLLQEHNVAIEHDGISATASDNGAPDDLSM